MKKRKISVQRDPVVEAYKSGIDVTLLQRSLRLTLEERLLRFGMPSA